MKFEYEKPNLEELDLVLEGSFLNAGTGSGTEENPSVPIEGGEGGSSTEWG